MPIAPARKNVVTITRDFRDKHIQRTGITHFGPDSKARAQSDTLSDHLIANHRETISAFNSASISAAVGEQLDMIGEKMGVPRLRATFAFSTEREQNFAFYVASGTFGSINGGAPITISAGSLIWSEANENELGTTIRYEVRQSTTLPAGSSIAYVSVKAVVTGSRSNIGEGVMRNHNFTSYVDAANNSLLVTNLFSVLNGRDAERDTAYRFRLAKNYDRLISSNEIKTRLEAVKVPGVLDVRVVPGYFGIGTAGVAVLSSDYQANPGLVRSVQANLNRFYGPGSSAIAMPAEAATFDLELEVKPLRALTVAEQRRLQTIIRAAALNYLRGIALGDFVDLNELADRIRQAGGGQVRIRQASETTGLFKRVYVRRGFTSGPTSEREQLKTNIYSLGEIEFADLGTLSISYL